MQNDKPESEVSSAQSQPVDGTKMADASPIGPPKPTPGPWPPQPPPPTNPAPVPPVLSLTEWLSGAPWVNLAYQPANWAADRCGGLTFEQSKTQIYEWVSALNPGIQQDDEVGVCGLAVNPSPSSADNPFFHPWGNDWEFSIAPDDSYTNLIAPSNSDPSGRYADDYAAAKKAGIAVPHGLLGVEIDSGLVPPDYQVLEGDRVAVYGRWIIDAGHSDFHAEIHPPLMMVNARIVDSLGWPTLPGPTATTLCRFWTRPYQVNQLFPKKSNPDINNPDDWMDLVGYLGQITSSWWNDTVGTVAAHATMFPAAYVGDQIVGFTVKVPGPAPSPSSVLKASFHFTVHDDGCTAQVIPSATDPTAVTVIVSLGSYTPPPPPKGSMQQLSVEDLINQLGDNASLDSITKWIAEYVIQYIYVDRFDPLSAVSSADSVNVIPPTPITAVAHMNGVSIGNDQPFPLYGWLKLSWA